MLHDALRRAACSAKRLLASPVYCSKLLDLTVLQSDVYYEAKEADMATLLTKLQELNTLDQAGFVQALSSLLEGPPWIVREAWYVRPFESEEQFRNS